MKQEKPSPQTQEAQNNLAQQDVKQLGPRPPEQAKAPLDERGGFKDLNLSEPTRYGDWESNGRCSDF
jgi:hypothetical protein